MKDTEPRDWSGRVSVSGADLAGLQGVRFSQQDRAQNDGSFSFRTKMGTLENQLLAAHPYGATDWGDPTAQRLIPEGLIVQIRGGDSARVAFASPAGSFTVDTTNLRFGETARVLDGNGMVERLPTEHKLSEPGLAADFPALAIAPDGAPWFAWTAYRDKADEVIVIGAGRVHHVSGRGDHFAPQSRSIRRDGFMWSTPVDAAAYQLFETVYARGNWSQPSQLTRAEGSSLWPKLVAGRSGHVALTWQGFRNGESAALAKVWNGRSWSSEQRVSEPGSNAWTPSLAYQGDKLWVVWDSYRSGNYQIYARQLDGPVTRVTKGEGFCVRPSIAIVGGAPIVAWEESDPLWGKDFAYLTSREGDGALQEPAN